jgi:hypothetical protein
LSDFLKTLIYQSTPHFWASVKIQWNKPAAGTRQRREWKNWKRRALTEFVAGSCRNWNGLLVKLSVNETTVWHGWSFK